MEHVYPTIVGGRRGEEGEGGRGGGGEGGRGGEEKHAQRTMSPKPFIPSVYPKRSAFAL